MAKLTETEKIDIAKYVVTLLKKSLTSHGPYDTKLGEWMNHAESECLMRLGNYLRSYNRIGR